MRNFFDPLIRDLRYAFRTMRNAPELTFVAVLSLSLGIGATIAIFTVMYALVLRPLPVPHPDELVTVEQSNGLNGHSYTEWQLFRERQDIFSGVAAFNGVDTTFEIGDPEQQLEVTGLYVSRDYFKTLGVSAALGRVLQSSDDRPGAPPVCVIGYGLWRHLYGKSKHVLGGSLRVNGHTVQIVGVLPRSFFGIVVGYKVEVYGARDGEDIQRLSATV